MLSFDALTNSAEYAKQTRRGKVNPTVLGCEVTHSCMKIPFVRLSLKPQDLFKLCIGHKICIAFYLKKKFVGNVS
jgi:hypothetical protein